MSFILVIACTRYKNGLSSAYKMLIFYACLPLFLLQRKHSIAGRCARLYVIEETRVNLCIVVQVSGKIGIIGWRGRNRPEKLSLCSQKRKLNSSPPEVSVIVVAGVACSIRLLYIY